MGPGDLRPKQSHCWVTWPTTPSRLTEKLIVSGAKSLTKRPKMKEERPPSAIASSTKTKKTKRKRVNPPAKLTKLKQISAQEL